MALKERIPIPEIGRADRLRFWSKVKRCAPDECWPWPGGKSLFSPHCIAYELEIGRIPKLKDGQPSEVMHSCDNPSCCNPAHLSVGTKKENMLDMVKRGRGATHSFPADWSLGRRAGPIRNQQMLIEGKPDLVVAFPGGRGTADMVRRARAAGVEVIEVAPSHPGRVLGQWGEGR